MKDSLGSVQAVLLLGGTSDIGLAIVEKLSQPRSASVVLGGRDLKGLERSAERVRKSGAGSVQTVLFDATDYREHDEVIQRAAKLAGEDLDVVIIAFGLLGNQEKDEAGGEGAVRLAEVNYVGTVSAGLAAARQLKAQGHGTLVVLSSVAGERVRRANFIYGSSKAGADGFAQGLGDSLAGSGARVLIVRPGFVTTKMTEGMPAVPLSTTAEAVAEATVKAIAAGREVIWVPGVLRVAFAVLRHLPRVLWRRIPM